MKIIIISLLVIGFIPLSFATELEHVGIDGRTQTFEYFISNGSVVDLDNYDTIYFLLNMTNGNFRLEMPKTIAFEYINYSDYIYTAIINDEFVIPSYTHSACDFIFDFDFDGPTEITFAMPLIPEGTRISYLELPEICMAKDEKYNDEIQQLIHSKDCTNPRFAKHINTRDELVCISPESYPWLYERGYLKTFPIIIQP